MPSKLIRPAHHCARRSFSSITLGELKELIDSAVEEHGADMPAVFTADYGDYTHTMQALTINDTVEIACMEESAYSRSEYSISENEPEDEDDGPDRRVIDPETEEPVRVCVIGGLG